MEGRILVAHHNEMILEVIQEMLQNVGYAATLTTDGHQALAKAMSEHYHLIIVDRRLSGGLDGSRLVERLRKYGVRTPILGTSGDTAWKTDAETHVADVDCFLPSPFGFSDLMDAAETLLNRRIRRSPEPELPDLQALNAAPETGGLALPEAPAPTPLPAPRPRPLRIVSEPENVRPWEPRALNRYEGAPRVLLVDTSDAEREQIAQRLMEAGYEVTAFKSGQDAYESTLLNDYELILTDLWLVGMDGFEMIDAMRKSGVETPIAIQTSYVTRDMVKELLTSRICKVLVKPIDADALLSFVEKTAVVS